MLISLHLETKKSWDVRRHWRDSSSAAPTPVKAFYANEAVLLDVSKKIRDLESNGFGLRLAGAGVLAPSMKEGSI